MATLQYLKGACKKKGDKLFVGPFEVRHGVIL